MDIPEKLREVLKKDGVVAIATLGEHGPHMVNTWNSYVRLTTAARAKAVASLDEVTRAVLERAEEKILENAQPRRDNVVALAGRRR